MKTVILNSLTLINFKGHKNLTVNCRQETHISGRNATGKSSIFDGFTWLFFGKDQFDRKDYEIIPTVEGKILDRVDSEAIGNISVDGIPMELKRVLRQKWVRRRGTTEEVFDGCETLFFVNGVPKKAGEYKAVIDSIIDETIFKLITNPSAFLSLHWQKQREFLFQVAGTVSDAQIAASNPKFAALLDMVSGKSLADFKREVSARKKKLKDDLDNIQPRIDQTTRLTPEARNWAEIESDIAKMQARINEIDELIADRAKAIRGQYEEIQRKQEEINGLKMQQQGIVNNAKAKAQQDHFEKNQERTKLSNEISFALQNVKNAEKERDRLSDELFKLRTKSDTINKEIEKLREDWAKVNEEEYKEQAGCLVCPIFNTECGDPTAKDKHQESLEKAKQAFFDSKEKRLNSISDDGVSKSNELKLISESIASTEKSVNDSHAEVVKFCEAHEQLKNRLSEMPESGINEVIADNIAEWKILQDRIDAIEATIKTVTPVDNSDLTEEKSQRTTTLDGLKKVLANWDIIANHQVEINRLNQEGANLAQQIADLEKTEFTIDDFTKYKINESEQRINRLFSIVRFKLFDKTIEGNEFECCIATNRNGVPISATNTAEQINAGMDIIATLMKFYNVSAPIFCDKSESVNEYIKPGAQMIFLEVTKEPVLTIN